MICKPILSIIFLNKHELIFLHIFQWFKVLLCNINNLIVICFKSKLICLHTSIAIVSTQLNDFNYCYLTLIILFNINHLFAHSEVVKNIAMYH